MSHHHIEAPLSLVAQKAAQENLPLGVSGKGRGVAFWILGNDQLIGLQSRIGISGGVLVLTYSQQRPASEWVVGKFLEESLESSRGFFEITGLPLSGS